MIPRTREEFKDYCLRKLGHPVIEVNVTPEQIDDRISESLKYYADYHFDGSEKIYYKHQITEEDKLNKYIILPENILGAVSVFNMGGIYSSSDMLFNVQYQIALNDLYTLSSVSLVPFYMSMQHLGLITELLVGQTPIRYTRHMNKLFVDTDWKKYKEGDFLLVEAYTVIDPEEYSDVWGDRWLQNYATAKIKYQWGSNLTKFMDMALPGGVRFNGEKIMNDALREIEKMEDEMISSYSLPVIDMFS